MNSPEAYIQFTTGLIDDEGNVSNESTKEFLRKFMQDFQAFLAMVVPCVKPPRN
jgi:chromate reductase